MSSKLQSSSAIFQAIGVIKGEVTISKKGLEVVIKNEKFALYYNYSSGVATYEMLKSFVLKGQQPDKLVVYPQFLHFPQRNKPQQLSFTLVNFRMPDHVMRDREIRLNDFEFFLRGIWQFIPTCKVPVVTIYRNYSEELKNNADGLDDLSHARRLKPIHVPTYWQSEFKPFKYNPKVEKQADKYFVQMKARLLLGRNCFGHSETLAEPILEIPPFLKHQQKRGKKAA